MCESERALSESLGTASSFYCHRLVSQIWKGVAVAVTVNESGVWSTWNISIHTICQASNARWENNSRNQRKPLGFPFRLFRLSNGMVLWESFYAVGLFMKLSGSFA